MPMNDNNHLLRVFLRFEKNLKSWVERKQEEKMLQQQEHVTSSPFKFAAGNVEKNLIEKADLFQGLHSARCE